MKTLFWGPQTSNRFARGLQWSKLISLTGLAQIAVQAIGFVTGIFLVHTLPTSEYALYTIVNTMLGTITLLADGGIAASVMAQGGKVWQDNARLGAVIATGFDLRRKFSIVSLVIGMPVLFFILLKHEAGFLVSALLIVSIIPAFYASFSDALLEVGPRLKQDIFSVQKNQLFANCLRLVLSVVFVMVFPWAFIAILISGMARVFANIKLKLIAEKHADLHQVPDPEIRKNILSVVRHTLPGSFYYSVSGQITIWLISIFGTTESVAEVGALGRLTMILGIFSSIFSILVVPRFSRLNSESGLLLRRFIQIQTGLLLLCGLIIASVFIFPEQIIWIIGNRYSDLTEELKLITIASCISLVGGTIYSLSLARGWVMPSLVNISLNVITQIVLILFLKLSDAESVLVYSIWLSAIICGSLLIFFFLKLFQSDKYAKRSTYSSITEE